ncbi:unnamed protein product (mitochondrion) [Plasmodiophora brassicae]|uniref:Uncharacterized protein n=1 Tax=Plasmodiophora brassicae TaxID=37360 RepID=A0A3P3Y1J1_PLABS|nr:unnamed protein product [Plasmodiophora brassicae]
MASERSVAQMEGSPWVGGAAGVVDTDGSARSSGRCIVKGDVESPSNGGAYEEGAPVDLAIVEHDMNPALLSAFTALFVELVHTRKAYPSAEVLADQLQSSPKLLQGWNVIRTTDSEGRARPNLHLYRIPSSTPVIHNTVQWLIKIAKACFEFQGCRALDRCDRRQRSQMTLITDNRTSIHTCPFGFPTTTVYQI